MMIRRQSGGLSHFRVEPIENSPRTMLLPRQSGRLGQYKLTRNGESAEDIESHEKTVEKLYRSLNPEAKIHWLDSDVMADTLGAIHCTTISIPHVNSENSAAKKLRITN